MITKDNYEIWMVDYLDGNLSDSDEAMLLQFLEENPELKSELDGLDNMVLTPVDDTFELKDQLLKTQADEMGMDYPDFVAIKEVEEELSAEEQEWKASFIEENKNNKALFEQYKNTVVKVNKSIRYQFKGNLKRALLVPMFTISGVKRIGVAATIALLLSVGTLPFLKERANDIKTVAVNPPASLITMPKQENTSSKKATTKPTITQENKAGVSKETKHENKIKSEPKTNIASLPLNSIEPLGITAFESKKVNAYEVGLNAIMPIIIANNIAQSEEQNLAMQSHVKEESARLSRSARAIVGGVKVINFLSGNETKMNKVLNQDGQMVAYQLESENISIRQRIKEKPVTN